MNVARIQGKELLIKNAKGNEIFTIVVRGEKKGYYGQFYQADVVAYPPGYSEFYSSLKSVETLRPSFRGISIDKAKWKMMADDSASRPDFDDSKWEIRTIPGSWEGEYKHAWYRMSIKLPELSNT